MNVVVKICGVTVELITRAFTSGVYDHIQQLHKVERSDYRLHSNASDRTLATSTARIYWFYSRAERVKNYESVGMC